MNEKSFDIVVIGSGPGGYVAAIRAAQSGMKTAIIERADLGGVCLNWGCIPTKTLLRSAEIFHLMKNAEEFGLNCKEASYDMDKIVQRSRNVASQLSKGVQSLMKSNNIEVLQGHGSLSSKNTIALHKYENNKILEQTATISAKNIILATGAKARPLPNLVVDNKRVLDYVGAMSQRSLPKSIVIVGGGAIGVEFASFYATMGSAVTIVEIGDSILAMEDHEISQMATKELEAQGIKILVNSKISKLLQDSVSIEHNGQNIHVECEKIISAAGVVAETKNMGLEKTSIGVSKSGHIVTNDNCQTAESNIYAIGDITTPPHLAHKASHEAITAVEHIKSGKSHPINRNNIPACTYCHPEIASIGLTEKEARKSHPDISVGRFPFIGNGKAIATGDGSHKGMIKTVYDSKTKEILGVHMIGHGVTEMIHSMAIAKEGELVLDDIASSVFPHPTISESLHESTLNAINMTIHMPNK